jgi:MerR family transcriptional regulator/heat shock protein HspR
MNPDLPLYEPDSDATYRLEMMAEMTGISSQTILHYQEHGLIRTCGDSPEFDEEALHMLRRIEHVRQTCGVNLEGLKLMVELMEELERLKTELRARRW